ncbi:MAG: nucleotidyltransferase domain-containing protein [Cyanobacteriota bacterium]
MAASPRSGWSASCGSMSSAGSRSRSGSSGGRSLRWRRIGDGRPWGQVRGCPFARLRQRLRHTFGATECGGWLFGSLARGDWDGFSDTDVLVASGAQRP